MKKELAEEMIQSFTKDFFGRFGVYPIINYTLPEEEKRLPALPLSVIEEISTLMMRKIYPDQQHEAGIRRKTRKRQVVIFRQIYAKIAQEVGYGPSSIALQIGFDHSTMIHACRIMKDLLESNHIETKYNYNIVLDAYKKRLGDDGNVPQDLTGRSDTK